MGSSEKTKVCPTCAKASAPREVNKASPFCSERCQLVDLSQWLDESYVIPGPPEPYALDD